MVWDPKVHSTDEASKVRWELVPYMHGTALDIGCGKYRVFPHFIGVDNGNVFGKQYSNIVSDAMDLSIFASQSFDCVFSSHLLEDLRDWKGALKEWWRLVKPGGYMALYLPHKHFYPNIGHAGANIDHENDFAPQDILDAMKEIPGWDCVENQERNETDEYSFFQVYRKVGGKQTTESWKDAKPAKTAAVVRFGAQGDMIQMSSILPWLKEQGYHVTVYCQPGLGHEVAQHDPHIDRFILCGKDHIPNSFLTEFFEYTAKKYDKWINLCESIEGTLLPSSDRAAFWWPPEARRIHMDRNYLEWTHVLAEVPPPYRPKFYATLEEKEWARKTAARWGGRTVLWSLAGSSVHKAWPHLDTVVLWLMQNYADVNVVMVGDEVCQLLEIGWESAPRVHLKSGKWSIRQSMAFAEVADLVIGCETGLLNAAGSMDVPKIVTLSHSSPEMLTKHWKNVIALEQPKGVGCPKNPCRQLHFSKEHCPTEDTTGTALCQFHIGPEMMISAIQGILGVPISMPQRRVA